MIRNWQRIFNYECLNPRDKLEWEKQMTEMVKEADCKMPWVKVTA